MHNESYSEQESKTHWIFALLLGIAGLLILLIFINVRSKADGTNGTSSTAALSNAAPYLTAVQTCTNANDPGTSAVCSTGANPSSYTVAECSDIGGTCTGDAAKTYIRVTGNYTDPNGCSEVTARTASPWDAITILIATSSGNGTLDNGINGVNYWSIGATGSTDGTCTFSTCATGVTDGTFNCKVALRYNMEPDTTNHWRAWVQLNDGSTTSTYTTYTSSTFDIDATLAIAVPATLTFTQGSNGGGSPLIASSTDSGIAAATSGDTSLIVYNTGNTAATAYRFYGLATGTSAVIPPNAFSCTSGAILNSALKWQLTSGVTFSSMASSTPSSNAKWGSTTTSSLGISTSKTIVSSGAQQTMYFKLQVPTGVSGTCSGSLYFTAV